MVVLPQREPAFWIRIAPFSFPGAVHCMPLDRRASGRAPARWSRPRTLSPTVKIPAVVFRYGC